MVQHLYYIAGANYVPTLCPSASVSILERGSAQPSSIAGLRCHQHVGPKVVTALDRSEAGEGGSTCSFGPESRERPPGQLYAAKRPHGEADWGRPHATAHPREPRAGKAKEQPCERSAPSRNRQCLARVHSPLSCSRCGRQAHQWRWLWHTSSGKSPAAPALSHQSPSPGTTACSGLLRCGQHLRLHRRALPYRLPLKMAPNICLSWRGTPDRTDRRCQYARSHHCKAPSTQVPCP